MELANQLTIMITSSLNIKGGGNITKRWRISQLISSGKTVIFFIQESKFKVGYLDVINSLWRNQNVGWLCSSVLGQPRGIITLWSNEFIEPIFSFKGGGFLG